MLSLLLPSTLIAAMAAVLVWSVVGVWWAFAAYAVVGATALLLSAALHAYPAPDDASPGEFAKPEVAG